MASKQARFYAGFWRISPAAFCVVDARPQRFWERRENGMLSTVHVMPQWRLTEIRERAPGVRTSCVVVAPSWKLSQPQVVVCFILLLKVYGQVRFCTYFMPNIDYITLQYLLYREAFVLDVEGIVRENFRNLSTTDRRNDQDRDFSRSYKLVHSKIQLIDPILVISIRTRSTHAYIYAW